MHNQDLKLKEVYSNDVCGYSKCKNCIHYKYNSNICELILVHCYNAECLDCENEE